MKNIKYYILLFILCLVPSFVNASDYKVKDYSITIDIDNNRNYKYSENINLIFEKSDVSVTKELDIAPQIPAITPPINMIIAIANTNSTRVNPFLLFNCLCILFNLRNYNFKSRRMNCIANSCGAYQIISTVSDNPIVLFF